MAPRQRNRQGYDAAGDRKEIRYVAVQNHAGIARIAQKRKRVPPHARKIKKQTNEIGSRRPALPVAYIPARKIEGLKAPLKWRGAFNCKFAEQTVFLQKTRDIRVRARIARS